MIRNIKGLRYPDEHLIRFFFKKELHETTGDVLELGCGNGNNLMLFSHFGWDVTGIDISKNQIDYANSNYSYFPDDTIFDFIEFDITKGIKNVCNRKFDIVLFPSVLNYISRESMCEVFRQSSQLAKGGTLFYLRMRSIKDYRYGRGKKTEPNGFILDIQETGEYGLLNVFYHEYEIIDMLREHLGVENSSLEVFHIDFGNVQNRIPICNSDIVVWGQMNGS